MTRLSPAEVAAIYERELSPEEFSRALALERALEAESGEVRAFVDWHMRRYPTPAAFRAPRRLTRSGARVECAPPLPGEARLRPSN